MKRWGGVVLVVVLCGCSTRIVSNTPRTAIEQLLLSGAVDKALEKFNLPILKDKNVYANFEHLKATDAPYIKVALRVRLGKLGATIIHDEEKADYIVEVASGGLGTEYKTFHIGIPPMPMPGTPIPTPEVSVFKTSERTGILKLLIYVHRKGRFISAHHYYAKYDRDENYILWWRFQTKDDIRSGWERADLENK